MRSAHRAGFRRRSYSARSQIDRIAFAFGAVTGMSSTSPIRGLIEVTTIEYYLRVTRISTLPSRP
jgi:hypothetical protein